MSRILSTLSRSLALAPILAPILPQGIQMADFGRTGDGTPVELYTLSNGQGMSVKIATYGGIVVELIVQNRKGTPGNVTLGFDNLTQYLGTHPYFGALIGRVANRIAKGRFTLAGVDYTLAVNNGPNHLHGGLLGFDRRVWKAEPLSRGNGPALRLTYLSKNGEEGYPGNLTCTVTYTVTKTNELRIDYTATTDKATPINLTNHTYFNLAGPGRGDILGHELMIAANHYLPVDETLIPTGKIAKVQGTPMDFTTRQPIGARIDRVSGGYDHCYVFTGGGAPKPKLVATVKEATSGRIMEVLTTEPAVQLYTGNFLDGSINGLGGPYRKHDGFCLETQHFPDSVNRPNFPSTILRPGCTYQHTTIYRFSTF